MGEIICHVCQKECNEQHDGGYSTVPKIKHYQVTRCSRDKEKPERDKGTFNHSPMLAYIFNKFYLSYINNPISETIPPSRTLLKTSIDGEKWSSAIELFPPYKVSFNKYCLYANMHHRMGFFISKRRKLYGLGFYGLSLNTEEFPNNGKGIGRVIREIQPNGQLGEIYFIRYNLHAGWDEKNTIYPYYLNSKDLEFINDCEELLSNKLLTQKWWEEDRSKDGFYSIEDGKAFTYYQVSDLETIGFWKWGKASISQDKGLTWAPLTKQPSIVTAGGKCWAEKITNTKYALVYNPTNDNTHRWPLAVTTSNDGKNYYGMNCLTNWVSPRKYFGLHKYYGPSYPTGLTAGSDPPPGHYTWIVYSMNKEDIWLSKVDLYNNHSFESANRDEFENWGFIQPKWGEIKLIDNHKGTISAINRDPYEMLMLQRWECGRNKGKIQFEFYVKNYNKRNVQLELLDTNNQTLVCLYYSPEGTLVIKDNLELESLKTIRYRVDAWESYSIGWNDNKASIKLIKSEFEFSFGLGDKLIGSIVFKINYTNLPITKKTKINSSDLINADYPTEPTSFLVRNFSRVE
ncbi:hypothetical protein [Jeotgalibacillus proteolyticus]|uniref:BT-1020-like N-terminal beta-propeller domain-containing protein n=1 Tax=Jeotgalibacillus proteolyticus TaxID=2082395 RepID=A0A2S5G6Z7_9BACL|nr:hypothetical protein [Jeotgalibacillus proteolyticus]PPA68704.1 hypothetical protein C4B60_19230 [Jeotgalibacillus proteolyticus]PPA68781.1 hypothetical protein C4B60_19660 [Jeotgalibacillus proteolyticus]